MTMILNAENFFAYVKSVLKQYRKQFVFNRNNEINTKMFNGLLCSFRTYKFKIWLMDFFHPGVYCHIIAPKITLQIEFSKKKCTNKRSTLQVIRIFSWFNSIRIPQGKFLTAEFDCSIILRKQNNETRSQNRICKVHLKLMPLETKVWEYSYHWSIVLRPSILKAMTGAPILIIK